MADSFPTHAEVPTLDEVQSGLGLAVAAVEAWRSNWAFSGGCYPAALPFLDDDNIGQACAWLKLDPGVTQAAGAAAAGIRANPLLRRLIWHGHAEMFCPGAPAPAALAQWPMLPHNLGPIRDMFYVLVLLSGLAHVRRQHAEHGISPDITRDTLADLELGLQAYYRQNGRWGLYAERLSWLTGHWHAQLFRLGQLQFAFGQFPFDYHVWRQRSGRPLLVLAGRGMQFTADGDVAEAREGKLPAGCWTADYAQEAGLLRGHLVEPDGRVYRHCQSWPEKDLSLCLKQHDPILEVHIPALGPLRPQACAASFRQALEFFPRHFPQRRFAAFTCVTWLLDPQLVAYLPADSNILRFQREFYLYPNQRPNHRQILERVWGMPVPTLKDAPQNTRLQMAVARHLRAGKQWSTTGGFILPQDLNWGAQVYQGSIRL